MIRKISILIFILVLSFHVYSQTGIIKIDVKDTPLNEVLVSLRDKYNFEFSYGDDQLSKYKITLTKTFTSKEEALKYLLNDLPLELRQSGDVFIIIPMKKTLLAEKKKPIVRISGQIVEAGSIEPLPFSHVIINNHPMVTDVMGSFNYVASADSSFHVRVSHLGYYVYDTIMKASSNQQIFLTPSTEQIPEITILSSPVEKASLIAEKPGEMKLNHNIAGFLPGKGDNSVFDLIRLMPGILASGELSTDLLIWGSYEGQSQITFDEYTIFGLKNYNDNII